MSAAQRRRGMSPEQMAIWIGFSVVIATGIVFGAVAGILSLIAFVPAVLVNHYWRRCE